MSLKRISVVNQRTNQQIDFYDGVTHRNYFGPTCVNQRDRITLEQNKYLRIGNQETGFYGLPQNNTNKQIGIDQNGWDFLNNYYSGRILTWQAEVFRGFQFQHIDAVINQNDDLLKIEVETESGIFYILEATLVSTYEFGTFEFDCSQSYWIVDGEADMTCKILKYTGGIPLIPSLENYGINGFNVDKVYFSSETQLDNEFTINATIESDVLITMTGVWENVRITNTTTGESIFIYGACAENCTISSQGEYVIIDGKEAEYVGTFPVAINGENNYMFNFGTFYKETRVCISRPITTGSVY